MGIENNLTPKISRKRNLKSKGNGKNVCCVAVSENRNYCSDFAEVGYFGTIIPAF